MVYNTIPHQSVDFLSLNISSAIIIILSTELLMSLKSAVSIIEIEGI